MPYQKNLADLGYTYDELEKAFKWNGSDITAKKEILEAFNVEAIPDADIADRASGGMDFSMSKAKRDKADKAAAAERNQAAQNLLMENVLHMAKTKDYVEKMLQQQREALSEEEYARVFNPDVVNIIGRDTVFIDVALDSSNKDDLVCLKQIYASGDYTDYPIIKLGLIRDVKSDLKIEEPRDLLEYFDYSDDQIINNANTIKKVIQFCSMLHDTNADIAGQIYTEEEEAFLWEYKGLAEKLLTTLQNRIDLMANPLYKELNPDYFYDRNFDPERMEASEDNEFEFQRNQHPLNSLVKKVKDLREIEGRSVIDRLTLNEANGLKGAVLNKGAELCPVNFKPVVAYTTDGEVKVITGIRQPKCESVDDFVKGLYDLTVEVDKYLLTGSKQFDHMQKVLKNMKQAGRSEETLEGLITATKAYLVHKGFDEGGSFDNDEWLEKSGKNAREKSRIAAAFKIYHYAIAHQSAKELNMEKAKEAKEKQEKEVIEEQPKQPRPRKLKTVLPPKESVVKSAEKPVEKPKGASSQQSQQERREHANKRLGDELKKQEMEKKRHAEEIKRRTALNTQVEEFYGECKSKYGADASSDRFGEILKEQAGSKVSLADLEDIVQNGTPFDYYRMVENIVVKQVATKLLDAKNPDWKNSDEKMEFSPKEKNAYVQTLKNIMDYRKFTDTNLLPIQDVATAFREGGDKLDHVDNKTKDLLRKTQSLAMSIGKMLVSGSGQMEQAQPKEHDAPQQKNEAPQKKHEAAPKPKSQKGRDIY